MLPSVVEELQRALEHRHQLTKPTPVLVQLWTQLEKTLAEGTQRRLNTHGIVYMTIDCSVADYAWPWAHCSVSGLLTAVPLHSMLLHINNNNDSRMFAHQQA